MLDWGSVGCGGGVCVCVCACVRGGIRVNGGMTGLAD